MGTDVNKLYFVILLFISTIIRAETVKNDELVLKKLNVEITEAEDRGDRKWFESVLAGDLAFRRSNGLVVGKKQFLNDLKSRGHSKTEVESVKIYGKSRAIVTCVVTILIDGKNAQFHNIRLFVREGNNWKLLGWANERLAD